MYRTDNSYVWNLGSYTTGTTAILSCNLGYTVSGSSTSTCSNGAWIPSVLGSCIQGLGGIGSNSILECTNPTVLNGMVTYSQGSTFDLDRPSGTVATLMCNAGFSPSGSTTATCQSGSWVPTLGMCTSSNSLFPGKFLAAPQGRHALRYSHLSVVPYPILLAAHLVRSTTEQSLHFGVTMDLYKAPPQPPASTVSGHRCLLEPAHLLVHFSTFYLHENRKNKKKKWISSQKSLASSNTDKYSGGSGLTCNSLFAPIGGALIYSSATPPYPSGTTVTLQCSSGTVSGTTCNAMTTPSGATLSYSNGAIFGPFNSGTTVTMRCVSGSPSGTTMATCTNGQWYPTTLGTCSSSIIGGGIGGQCPPLTAPSGGTLTMSNGLPGSPAASGTVATLVCPSGVQGTSSVLCSNGAWTPPTLGTCIGSSGIGTGTSCQSAPTTPLGATLSYSNFAIFPPFPSGTTVTARCLSGAMISGLTCPSVQQVGGAVDYSDGPFSTAHPSGSTATLLCNSGVPIGSALSTCQNGQWVPAIGSCSTTGIGTTGQCTVAPTTPFGATLTYSSGGMFGPWNSGTTATMTCPFGQTVVGGVTSTCTNGFWTALGTCSATGANGTGGVSAVSAPPCYLGILAPSHGNITYSDSPPYPSGTIATLTCSTGYTVTGASTSNCTSGSFSPIGTCQ
ncbi:sushi domain protein [Ancylostoma caninum]|uniref:Sushi domain protein n=1 Tax=Ancylostoma caninum TaxID=29170 RepID=A0A368GX64_ANCCA|nr:sushi domain protein [Ancylostoma caninum]